MNSDINIKNVFSNTRGYFILCLSSIAIGLSISKPLTSLGLFGLLLVWLIDGNIRNKLISFYKNKNAVLISSIYLLTLLGLVYTSNFEFAIGDVRRKIPLFFLPFYFSGFQPLSKKELALLLKVFISGVLIATFWSFFVYLGGLNVSILDKRELSRFNSHIRFGLEVALALFFSFYYYKESASIKVKLIWALIMIWLLFSLYIFNLFSGTSVFLITTVILVLMLGLYTKNKKKKLIFLSFFFLLMVSLFFYINNSISNFYKDNNVEPIKEIPFTENGGKYHKDNSTESNTLKENGYYIARNVAWKEFSDAWNELGTISFEEKDKKGQNIKNTLLRFITSKGERKDRKAIENLTGAEIQAIENGIPNYKYLHMNNMSVRVHKIIWEFDANINGQDINAHSISMRLEYWKTALRIIKKNLIFGVGTGDVQDAFDIQYEKDKSRLTPKYRLRAHNQYLTHAVSFGVIGLIWFLICLVYPIFKTKLYRNYLYLAFFSIVMLSMLTEDTLETQIGINFFVFFNTILLLSLNVDEQSENAIKD